MTRAFLIAAVVCTIAVSARATTGNSAGLIAFTRYRLQDSPIWSEIWVARPDGSGAHKVSHSSTAVEDDQAQWSPRGDWIVFDRCPPHNAPCSIWIVRPDGGQQHVVASCATSNTCNYSNASFTPDGNHLVFVHDFGQVKQGAIPDDEQIDHSAIVESDLAGSHVRILRRQDGYTGGFSSPRVSPNGSLLLFDHYAWSRTSHTPDVLSVAPFGGGAERRVVPHGMQAQSGSWSPDGTSILFKPSQPTVGELTPGSNLYVVAPDGTHLQRVTNVGAYHYVLAGSFSPDGKSIVYATDADAAPNPLGRTFADVFTLRLGSKRASPVTRTANLDGWPAWGR